MDAVALFVLIGAEPRTQRMPDAVRRDRPGFVVSGTDVGIVWRGQNDGLASRVPADRRGGPARPVVAQVCGLVAGGPRRGLVAPVDRA
jgi:hypothetical protein